MKHFIKFLIFIFILILIAMIILGTIGFVSYSNALKEKPLFEGSIKASKYNGQAWSAMSEDNYKQLQSEIRAMPKEENESPIEWEGRVWIKMANKGNSNKSNSK